MNFKQSPNFAKGTSKKLGFVLHGTLGSYAGAVEWLLKGDRPNPSSAHYIIGKKDGEVIQLVKNEDVAWHCGTVRNPLPRADQFLKKDPTTGKYINPNQYLIGIEFVWFPEDGATLTEWQYKTALEIIKNSGIPNPILVDHHSVCDYKTDDIYFGVLELTKRLTLSQTGIVRPTHTFSTPLPYGTRSSDVVFLQQILIYEGLLTRGGDNGTYDDATAKAVKLLQLKHSIASPTEIEKLNGQRVGALTINYLNKTYGH